MRSFVYILLASATLANIRPTWAVAQSMPAVAPALTSPPAATQSQGDSRTIEMAIARLTQEDEGNILIPGPSADPNVMAQLGADLLVMCRILDKTVRRTPLGQPDFYGEPFRPLVMGGQEGVLNRFLNPYDSQTKALYIRGYGALFTINVRFPLKPAPTPKTEARVAEPVDPIWSETRQEIFEPHRSNQQSSDPAYDASLVDQLKRQIRSSLRHVANIRGISADESITVVVQGFGARSNTSVPTLTLRASKPDVDARAAGTLSADDFAAKVEVIEF